MAIKRPKPEEIVVKLRQVEVLMGQGMPRIDAIRQISVTEQTYYRWKKKYGGMGTEQLKELKRLQKEIDLSALESLETIDERLREMDVKLHLSEVKGPVMDRLAKQHFLQEMTGAVFLTQYEAARLLSASSSPSS